MVKLNEKCAAFFRDQNNGKNAKILIESKFQSLLGDRGDKNPSAGEGEKPPKVSESIVLK